VDGEVKELLRSAIQQLGLSARAYHRILKLSRTIADQGSRPATGPRGGSGLGGGRGGARGRGPPGRAIQYRPLDRRGWWGPGGGGAGRAVEEIEHSAAASEASRRAPSGRAATRPAGARREA